MKTSVAILVVSLVSITPALVSGTPIAQWTFDGSTQAPASVVPDATGSNFTLNSGGVTFPQGNPSTSQAISGTGWNVSDGVKWWDFTVTANAGYLLDLTSLTFDDQRSSSGPVNWSVTINGVAAASGQNTHGVFSAYPMNTVDLTAFPDMTSVDVRIFGYGASGSTGTWRLDNVTLNGTVPSVPDSLPLEFAAVTVLGMLFLSRRLAGCFPQTNSC